MEVPEFKPKEIKTKKVKPHVTTNYIRKRFQMPKYNTNM